MTVCVCAAVCRQKKGFFSSYLGSSLMSAVCSGVDPVKRSRSDSEIFSRKAAERRMQMGVFAFPPTFFASFPPFFLIFAPAFPLLPPPPSPRLYFHLSLMLTPDFYSHRRARRDDTPPRQTARAASQPPPQFTASSPRLHAERNDARQICKCGDGGGSRKKNVKTLPQNFWFQFAFV